jgi:hypothetical protein
VPDCNDIGLEPWKTVLLVMPLSHGHLLFVGLFDSTSLRRFSLKNSCSVIHIEE